MKRRIIGILMMAPMVILTLILFGAAILIGIRQMIDDGTWMGALAAIGILTLFVWGEKLRSGK